jgi:hypothetical protein
MRVYRVGHAEKVRRIAAPGHRGLVLFPAGPYNGLSAVDGTADLDDMQYAHSCGGSAKHHPAPHEDPALVDIAPYEVCGFTSLDALLDWFDTWLRVLDEADFRVWVYDVPDASVRIGQRFGQLVFIAADAVLVEDFQVPLEDAQLALF